MVTENRLEQFLQAELSCFAQRQPSPLKLQQIVHLARPHRVARLVHTELPVRFALRIKHIESWPGWHDQPDLVALYQVYTESFRDLRLVEVRPRELDNFTATIKRLRQRQRPALPLVSSAMRTMHQQGILDEGLWKAWADQFLLHRVSTEMLTAHYVACAEAHKQGIVDRNCSPGEICQQAVGRIRQEYEGRVQFEMEHPRSSEKIEFSTIPRYLTYIVEELLRNSARATLARRTWVTVSADKGDLPIRVTVSADKRKVAIRISDKGGGIPSSSFGRIWSYLYSTSTEDTHDAEGPGSSMGMPLRGFGLPLSRLYCRYLGGSLELFNVPGVGVDVYLFLSRIDAQEVMETDSEAEVPLTAPNPRRPEDRQSPAQE